MTGHLSTRLVLVDYKLFLKLTIMLHVSVLVYVFVILTLHVFCRVLGKRNDGG